MYGLVPKIKKTDDDPSSKEIKMLFFRTEIFLSTKKKPNEFVATQRKITMGIKMGMACAGSTLDNAQSKP